MTCSSEQETEIAAIPMIIGVAEIAFSVRDVPRMRNICQEDPSHAASRRHLHFANIARALLDEHGAYETGLSSPPHTIASLHPSVAISAARSGASLAEKNSSSCGGFTLVAANIACTCPR